MTRISIIAALSGAVGMLSGFGLAVFFTAPGPARETPSSVAPVAAPTVGPPAAPTASSPGSDRCDQLAETEEQLAALQSQNALLKELLGGPEPLSFPTDGSYSPAAFSEWLDAWEVTCPAVANHGSLSIDCDSYPCVGFVSWNRKDAEPMDIWCSNTPSEVYGRRQFNALRGEERMSLSLFAYAPQQIPDDQRSAFDERWQRIVGETRESVGSLLPLPQQ